MRILFVAFPQSVHTARWISQISDQGWDVHLFPSSKDELHHEIKNITTYGFSSFRPNGIDKSVRWRQLWPHRGTSRLSTLVSRFKPAWLDRSLWLARLIRKIKPDIVHSMEFQHAGYLTLAAKKHLADEGFPPWLASNWGSDIYLFSRLGEHVETIRAVLENCDYYHCECHRDVELARSFGFRGEVLSVIPNSGGFDITAMRHFAQPGPTSARRVIALKGYQHWAGRALVGVRAIEMCADVLGDYKVKIYGTHPDVMVAGKLLMMKTGIPVEQSDITTKREDVLRIHGSARISIGLSISDAISTSLLEALIMGSFPIQSDTSCANEWIHHGESGFLVPAEDPCPVADAIRKALADDELVDRASTINHQTAKDRLDTSVIRPQVIRMYKEIPAHRSVNATSSLAAP